MVATSREITPPAFTIVVSFFRTTFPFSIAAGNPACCSSPTIGPGLKLVVPAGTTMSAGRELAAPGGGRGAGLEELLIQGERVPLRGEDRGLVLDLVEQGGERRPLLHGPFERVPDGAVLGDHDRLVPRPQVAPHVLQRGRGNSPDADERGHRASEDGLGELLDMGELFGSDRSTSRHARSYQTRTAGPMVVLT